MTRAPSLSPRLMRAMDTAAHAHRDHRRKGSGVPYISHLFAVMYLASRVTDDEDVLVACLLHDTLEDVPGEYSEERMRREFGDRVTAMVLDVTKDPDFTDWRERNEAYLRHLDRSASDEAVLVACADKLHNLKSILVDHEQLGDALWERFNAGREQQKWWYGAVHELTSHRLPGLALNDEFREALTQLERL